MIKRWQSEVRLFDPKHILVGSVYPCKNILCACQKENISAPKTQDFFKIRMLNSSLGGEAFNRAYKLQFGGFSGS